MSGPPPKPAGRRQRRNKPSQLRVVPGALAGREAPSPPAGMLKRTRTEWDRYWRSPVAQLADPDTDLPAIERLFSLYDERRRAYAGFRKERLVLGSQGQMVLNPLGRLLESLDKEIRALEDRLGLTPKARLALGVAFGEARRSLEDLNRSLDDDHGDEDEDPRFRAL